MEGSNFGLHSLAENVEGLPEVAAELVYLHGHELNGLLGHQFLYLSLTKLPLHGVLNQAS